MTSYPDLPGFQKEPRELVHAMVEAGWTGRLTSKGHWIGKAPDGATATVQARVGDRRGQINAEKRFERWLEAQMSIEEKNLLEKVRETEDPVIKVVMGNGLTRKRVEALREQIPEPEPTVRPWLARKNARQDGGVRYESQAVLERVWPDGHIDYLCAFPGCEYVNDSPRSVAAHFGKGHTANGESEPAGVGPHHLDPEYTEPASHREYRPTERLVAAIMEVLERVEEMSHQDAAIAILTWMNDRPDLDPREDRPLIPLTDKQILDRIRVLVGVMDQAEEIARLTCELVEARRMITRLREEKRALRDLLSEEDES